MPKMVVYELFAVTAKNAEEAIEKAKEGKRRGSLLVAAESLDQLAHPVHLEEAQEKFGNG